MWLDVIMMYFVCFIGCVFSIGWLIFLFFCVMFVIIFWIFFIYGMKDLVFCFVWFNLDVDIIFIVFVIWFVFFVELIFVFILCKDVIGFYYFFFGSWYD